MGNRTKLYQSITLSLFIIGLTGCIKEDITECPPSENQVELSVKDKNYSNIDKVPQLNRIDENLPFNGYVQTLNYSLLDTKTGKIIESAFLPATESQNATQRLSFNNLPEGDYELSVFGNTSEDIPSNNLHPGNKSYSDIYVTSGTFSVKPNQNGQVFMSMERGKGLLLIDCQDFPPSITQIETSIQSIYRYIDAKKVYSDTLSVIETTPLKKLNQAYISPTVSNTESILNLRFLDDSNKPILNIPPLSIQIKRNEVSVVSVVYNPENRLFEVWSNINGEWTKYHQLTFK